MLGTDGSVKITPIFSQRYSIRMNETPRNEAFVDELKFYFFFVETAVFMQVYCLVDFFRNCTLLTHVIAICCCIHLGIPLIASPDDEVMVQCYKNIFLLTCDLGISIFRVLYREQIFSDSLSQLAILNLPMLFTRLLLNVPLVLLGYKASCYRIKFFDWKIFVTKFRLI